MDTQLIILDQSNPDMHLKKPCLYATIYFMCVKILHKVQNEESNLLKGHQGWIPPSSQGPVKLIFQLVF